MKEIQKLLNSYDIYELYTVEEHLDRVHTHSICTDKLVDSLMKVIKRKIKSKQKELKSNDI